MQIESETPKPSGRSKRTRWIVYFLLAATSAIGLTARIGVVASKSGKTPFLSANDRSRWDTIRSLVDHGTYVIDDVILDPRTRRFDKEWRSIDMVRHRGWDGREHYYSSKPPLYPTLLAGEYWLLKQTLGWRFPDDVFRIGRVMLVATNMTLMLLFVLMLADLVERFVAHDWTRIAIIATAAWATLLSAYSVALNNHTPAAVAALACLWLLAPVVCRGNHDETNQQSRQKGHGWRFFLAGLAAGFTVANELPALSFLVLLGAWLLWKQPRWTLLAYTPGVLLMAIAFFGTNYAAHASWRPPYAHRHDGPLLTTMPVRDEKLPAELSPVSPAMRSALGAVGVDLSAQAVIMPRAGAEEPKRQWVVWDRQGHDRLAVLLKGKQLEIHAWDNWYDYDSSYWRPGKKRGVDLGEPSRWVYAFHCIVGHHGLLSLTPLLLLSAIGCLMLCASGGPGMKEIGWATLILTAVCLTFYIARPIQDRNYGGVSCGLRWMLWLTPFWLLCMAPVCERLQASKGGRALFVLLFAASAFSAHYACLNPWTHPWIFQLGSRFGWFQY